MNTVNIVFFSGWPLNRAEVPISPFVTGSEVRGHNGWGQVLRRYFMNSKAAAIIVDDSTPLWVSVNANQSQLLCLQSRSSGFPFFDHGEDPNASNTSTKRNGTKNNPIVQSVLNYTICTAGDLETLLTSLADAWWDGLRKDEMEVKSNFMTCNKKSCTFGWGARIVGHVEAKVRVLGNLHFYRK